MKYIALIILTAVLIGTAAFACAEDQGAPDRT
jgi:hypothetical protein